MKLFWTLSRAQWPAVGLLLAGFILSGCSSSSEQILFSDSPQPPSALTGTDTGTGTAPADTNSGDLTAARFHIGDNVTVDYSGTATPIPENVQTITENGNITLPYIGAVRALGKTAGELQNDIHDLYVPKYYVRLTVTVSSPQRVFYVGGEVKQPGRQLYIGETTVTKAIQAAGDFTDFANQKRVKLIRHNGEIITVNCVKALKDPSLDAPVYPGDQIQVPRRIF
ncbi:MAG TPA: polysaccharide biosynthesis/export family protein [Verrucomicrobiae bacterium]|nr:polysaccharide biosynthesis/export family protein [Verrucomicrobiae bacterium]